MRVNRTRLKTFVSLVRKENYSVVQLADLAVLFLKSAELIGDDLVGEEPEKLRKAFRTHVDFLVEFGGINRLSGVGQVVAYEVAFGPNLDAEEIACGIDIFGYLSHLSAMSWHGLTDRLPKTMYLSHPDAKHWRKLASERLADRTGKLWGIYQAAKLPAYTYPEFEKINRRPVNVWASSRLAGTFNACFKNVSDDRKRVATVGRSFLDMVREPDLCGGIYHVMDVYKEHGAPHLQQIINEIEAHGTKIEQARAGYLLEERCSIEHATLGKWAAGVARGGSRKLDPNSDYSDQYSERWALSINV